MVYSNIDLPFEYSWLAMLFIGCFVFAAVSYYVRNKSTMFFKAPILALVIALVLSPAIVGGYSFYKQQHISDKISKNEVSIFSGRVDAIDEYHGQSFVHFGDTRIVLNRANQYCLSNTAPFTVGNDYVLRYVDLDKFIGLPQPPCIIEVGQP